MYVLTMILSAVFERFAKQSPVTVMTRALLEHALSVEALDALFTNHAQRQYQKDLLFSSVVDLMGLVVCRMQPSIGAAYRAMQEELFVSQTAVYDKIDGIEPEVTAALVQQTASRLSQVVEALGGGLPPLLPGYRVRIIDGNHLKATERRLAELRECKAGPLPGQALVILDPALMLATHMIPCEDAHAQERSLFNQVLPLVTAGDLWIADRNFCTRGFVSGILQAGGVFVLRQHGKFPITSSDELRSCGRSSTGEVFEQSVAFVGEDGESVPLRRILVHLDKPTQDGDTEVAVLTPASVTASAAQIADLYLKRWSIEGVFLTLTQTLDGEIPSLGYPKASLFAFGIALVSFNIASVLRAALRATFGHEKVEKEVSWYYIANEIRFNYGGMDVAVDEEIWAPFQSMSATELAAKLREYASNVRLSAFKRTSRGPKKPAPRRTKYTNTPHVSTARLLARAGHKV